MKPNCFGSSRVIHSGADFKKYLLQHEIKHLGRRAGFEESAPTGQINFSSPSGAWPVAPDSAITPLSNIAAHEQTKNSKLWKRKRSNERKSGAQTLNHRK